jgi:hypothetical protein
VFYRSDGRRKKSDPRSTHRGGLSVKASAMRQMKSLSGAHLSGGVLSDREVPHALRQLRKSDFVAV